MANVDRRIVEMRFDNKDFEKNVGQTLISLETLQKALQMQEGQNGTEKVKKGLLGLGQAARQVNTSNLSNNVEQISNRFSTLGIIGTSILQNIGNRIADVAFTIKNKLLAPLNVIKQGGLTRAFNLEQANFQIKGLGIEKNDTASYYTEVMDAVLGTAYSYDVAAKAASQLAASNVGVIEKEKILLNGTKATAKYFTGDMTQAILGIAGVASMTGSSFDDISQVFTRVAGQGKVMSNDLNSISARGLNAAATLKQYFNDVNSGTVKASDEITQKIKELSGGLEVTEGDIRDFVTKGEIDFNTFSAAMTEAFGEHAKDSTKTFTGALEDVKAALSRIGADFFGPALTAGRDIINSMTPLVDVIHDKIQWALDDSGKLMGKYSKRISAAIDLITMSGSSFTGEFGEKFPPLVSTILKGADSITSATEQLKKGPVDAFKLIGDHLDISSESAKRLAQEGHVTFKTYYEALDKFAKSGKEGSAEVKNYLADLASEMKRYENIFDVFGDKGRKIGAIGNAFDTLAESLDVDADKVKEAVAEKLGMSLDEFQKAARDGALSITDLRTALGDLVKEGAITEDQFKDFFKVIDFTVLDDANVAKKISDFETVWKGLTATFSVFGKIAKNLGSIFVSLLASLAPVGRVLLNVLEAFNSWIIAVDAGDNKAGKLLKLMGDGLFNFSGALESVGNKVAGAGKNVLGFFSKLTALVGPAIQGLAGLISEVFDQIGIVIGKINFGDFIIKAGIGTFVVAIWNVVRTIATFARSLVESGILFGSMGTIFNEFRLSLIGLQTTLKLYQNSLKANILLKIAGAIMILAIALKVIASIDSKRLDDAVIAIGALFSGLVVSLNMIKPSTLLQTKKGMIAFAIAVLILAKALEKVSKVEKMGKGLAGLGAIMLEIVAFSYAMRLVKPRSMLMAGASMIIFAEAIKMLVKPINELGGMDVGTLKQGLTALGGLMAGMVVFAAAMRILKPKKLVQAGASMVLIAVAMRLIVKPIKELGSMDLNSIKQGLIAIGVAMGLMAGYSILVTKASKGGSLLAAGAALVLMATGVKIMAKAIDRLSGIENIGTGLSAMFGALIILAGAMLIMQKAVAGAAAMIIVAAALTIMAPAIALLSALNFEGVGAGLLALAGVLLIFGIAATLLAPIVPQLLLLSVALIALGAALTIMVPAIALLSSLNIMGVVAGLLALAGTLALFAGAAILLTPVIPSMLLLGAAMLTLGGGLLALGAGLTLLASAFAAGAPAILLGIQQLVEAIPSIIGAFVGGFLDALNNCLPKLLTLLNNLFDIFIQVTGQNIPRLILLGLKLIIALLTGIRDNIQQITTLALEIITNFINGVADGLPALIDAGFNLVVSFFDGMADAISTRGPEIIASIQDMLLAIVEVFVGGIPFIGGAAADAIAEYRAGLSNGKTGVQQTTKGVASSAEAGMRLKNMSGEGKKGVKTLETGISSGKSGVKTTAKNVASSADMKVPSQYDNGKNATQGLIDGLGSILSSVREKARQIANTVNSAVQTSLGIHSPSRVMMENGRYIMLGLIKGMDALTPEYERKADNIATTMISSINSATNAASSFGLSDMSLSTAVAQSSDVNLRMADMQRENDRLYSGISKLTNTLDGMTESMNSRALNNYITVDGSADPETFADGLIRSFRLNARTV